jgi:hypothetical protein
MFSRINNSHQQPLGGSGTLHSALSQLAPAFQPQGATAAHAAPVRGWPVTVSVEGIGFSYQLTNDDLYKVFSRYGVVTHVEVLLPEGNSATVCFSAYDEASRAIASLDGKELAGVKGHLRVSWGQLPTLTPGVHFGQTDSNRMPDGQRKFTCRFEIGIDNDKDFQVARRIIGQKGMNMKEIVNRTDAKLRLRGRGSGYLEGLTRQESPEPLHLCVSCTSRRGYTEAARMVSELLERVYAEYREYCISRCLPVNHHLRVTIREHPLGSGPYPSLDMEESKQVPPGLSSMPTAVSSPVASFVLPPCQHGFMGSTASSQ